MIYREYRICMPFTVEEYRIGQLYTIARHSYEQTGAGNGVETVANEPCEPPADYPHWGPGQFTEKRIYLRSHLPGWISALIPSGWFFVTEKAYNHYPNTLTVYTFSLFPRLDIRIITTYEDNPGTTENVLNLSAERLAEREVVPVDIVNDKLHARYEKVGDCSALVSTTTGRGPLGAAADWMHCVSPVMCSYKFVSVSCPYWLVQSRLEAHIQQGIREILTVSHRQTFLWIDEWYEMDMEALRRYEADIQRETNAKLARGIAEKENSASPLLTHMSDSAST